MSKKIFKNDDERLKYALERNRGTYSINKDGIISIDMDNSEVREHYCKQIEEYRKVLQSMREKV